MQPDAGLYHFINQGVLTVEGMNDRQEMDFADVCITFCIIDRNQLVLWR